MDLDRTRRIRAENTTLRNDRDAEGGAGALAHLVRHVPVTEPTRGREALVYPVPAHRSFFLPLPPQLGPSAAAGVARAEFCEDMLDALALGVGDYFEKTRAFKTIGVALSGGRDSLLCLIIARRYLDQRYASLSKEARDARGPRDPRARSSCRRASPSPETRAAAERAATELGVPLVTSDIEDAFERELAEVAAMLQPGEALDAADAPERPGARPRGADVELGEQRRRASSSRRAT